ncbi:MAG: NAD-dependent epimerase/dehydratase family protein [Bradyrhizobium icense]|jgi:UDP-glucuronate decarboxylase|nr:MAG: NAD-dependent epimerase/dehydratase family protein [Bradyrhizobium icense]
MNDDVKDIIDNLGQDVHRFAGKTVLIAGGAGFLGRHFLAVFKRLNKEVLAKPCRVISADNYITGDQVVVHDNEHFDGNIIDVWADVSHPLPVREDLHFILHAAGVASPVYYMKYPLETIESAVQGSKNLLELARKNSKLEGFLFFSSSEIYGDPDPKAVPTPETYHGYVSSVGPRACYDESKRLGETIATIYHQQFNVPVKIVRPFNVFGPGMKHNDRRVIPMFTYEALNGRALPVHGTGTQTRTFCYVTDAITGFLKTLLLGKPGEPYNIGNSNNEISMADLAKMFEVAIPGTKTNFVSYPDVYPAGEPQRRCPDLTKAAQDLGYASRIDVKTGLTRFVDWAKAQEGYWDKKPA